MEKDYKTKLQETKKLILDATRGKNKGRIPLISNDRTWKVFHAGYNLREGLYDYEKMEEAVYKFHEDFQYDAYVDLGNRNKLPIMDCFGSSGYQLDEAGELLNFLPLPMTDPPAKILKELAEKGTKRYAFENLIPTYYGIQTKEELAPVMKKAAAEFLNYSQKKGRIVTTMREKYGVPTMNRGGTFYPIELLLNSGVLGMREMGIAMRRNADALADCLEALSETWKKECIAYLDRYVETEDDHAIFPYAIGNLTHTIMSPKQFARFVHPYQMWLANELKKRGLTAYLNIEGSMAHLTEFYQELPDGVFCTLIEQDDPVQFRKWCPNLTLMGGYPTSYLSNKTPEQCVDKAKELMDALAGDGRWIYSEDKLLSYRKDVRAENLRAVTTYIREHGAE